MARRYSTRSRRAGGSATAEPAVDGLNVSGAAPSAGAGHFARNEFRDRLEELSEACSMPGRLVLVTGPARADTSLVCEALLADVDPSRSTAYVSANQNDPYRQVLAAILEAYGETVEPGASRQAMSELIAHLAGDPAAPAGQCVLVLDNAHELPPADLQALLALIDGSALTLVLAGPGSLVPAVERVARQFSFDLSVVRLTDLGSGEADARLQSRQTRAESRAGASATVPSGGAQARPGLRRTQVLPDWLRQLLAQLDSAGAGGGRAPGPFGFPLRHLAILAGLLLALLVVYFVGQVDEDAAAPAERVETLAMPPLGIPEEVPGAGAAAGAPVEEEPAARPPVSRAPELPLPARTTASDDAGAAAPRPIIARPTPGGSGEGSQQPAARTPAATASGTPAVPAASVTPNATEPKGASRNASWIMEQPAASYTVQLVSLSSAERARAYIAQQPDPAAFATYRLLRNGQLFHVVVYGSFATKAQAEQAAGRLPRSVGNIQPWVRQFGQIQESARTTPQA